MGAEGEEEEEAMKGGGSFLNFQIFSENSGCFIQLMRDLQHCSRGCLWWDIKLSLAKAKLNLYHLDASVSNLWRQFYMGPRAVGLGNENQDGLYLASLGTHHLSKFQIIIARNNNKKDMEAYATSL